MERHLKSPTDFVDTNFVPHGLTLLEVKESQ
jgi:hypothetical protein